jgi:hypothetical protein
MVVRLVIAFAAELRSWHCWFANLKTRVINNMVEFSICSSFTILTLKRYQGLKVIGFWISLKKNYWRPKGLFIFV